MKVYLIASSLSGLSDTSGIQCLCVNYQAQRQWRLSAARDDPL